MARPEGGTVRAVIGVATIAVLLSLSVLAGDGSRAASIQRALHVDSVPHPMTGSDWTEMNPSSAPSGYLNMAMVYDSGADRMIAFGGYDHTPHGSNETWAYDFNSNTWTNMSPPIHPDATQLDRAAYDSWGKRTILFGGYIGTPDNGTYSNDTWAYDSSRSIWTNLRPAQHPSGRSRQGMAFDTQSDRVVIFGGHTIENTYSNETWAYSLAWNTWAHMTPSVSPPGRRSPGMVYDSKADRMILFGGFNPSDWPDTYNDTWAYDFETNTWTNMSPPTAPSPRFGFGFAYDSGIDRCILFGGANGGDNVTWAYDFSNNSWTVLGTDHSPSPHQFQGMAYDSESAATIMFGGSTNDTWALQTQPSPPFAPQGLSATGGNGTVSLSWEAPAGDGLSPITGYRVYRGPDMRNLTAIADLGDVLAYLDGTVTNGVSYVYRVSAVNAIGEGPMSPAAHATPDGAPPVTTASLSGCTGLAGWFTCSGVTVSLQASDDVSGVAYTSYRVDGGPWQKYAAPFSVADDGVHSVDFYSVDNVGNVEGTQSVFPSIDTMPPISRAVLNGSAADSYWFRSEVTVTLDATDATSGVASIDYRVDSGDGQVYSSAFTVGEGTHVLEWYGTDVAGNSEAHHAITFGVDTTAPSAGVRLSGSRGDNGWYTGSVIASIDAMDATSGVSVSYRIDGGDWTSYTGSFAVSGDGVHTIGYLAVDGAGNSESGSARFSIDATPPRTLLTTQGTAGQAGWFVSPVTVSLEAQDLGSGVSGIRVQIDGGALFVYASPILLADGVHRIDYAAFDAAGNTEPLQTAAISIDATPPQSDASFSGQAGNHGWYRTTVQVTLHASDVTSGVSTLAYRVDAGGWIPYGSPFSIESGIHTILYAAKDVAGLTEVAKSVVVQVDDAPPTFGTIRPSGHLTGGDVTLTWSAADSGSGIDHYEVSVDGGAWTSVGSEPRATVHLSDGAHTVRVRAVDVAGNVATSSADVAIDTNAFSLGGPYGGLPTFAILAAIVVLTAAVAMRRRLRRA